MTYPDEIKLTLVYKHDDEDGDDEIFTEKVAAEKFGDYYKLVHVPAFACNIAYGDIVAVEYEEGEFYFNELIEESGFSVLHVVFFKPDTREEAIYALQKLGCSVNSHIATNYLVVCISPTTNYQPIRMYLLNQQSLENISFRESCLGNFHTLQIGSVS